MSKYLRFSQINRRKHVPERSASFWQRLLARRVWLNIFMLVVLLGLGVSYLLQINTTATSGFAVKDMNTELRDLREEQQKLQLTIADLQSLHNIQLATERLQLVAQTRLEFINPTAGAVALEK